jgi:RNA-binding protein Luc7-like 2
MKVCEICGALQSLVDTEKSMIHLDGKLHTGFGTLRKELAILKIRIDEVQSLMEQEKKDSDQRKLENKEFEEIEENKENKETKND